MATLNPVLRVFVSSKQAAEFDEERRGMADIVSRLPLLAIDIAEDWAPRRESIEATSMVRVRAAAIYVGLFGRTYSAPAAREYEAAIENPYREVLVYVKSSPVVDEPLARLIARLDQPHEGHATRHYDTWAGLKPHFEAHLWAAVTRMVERLLQLAGDVPAPRGGSSVMKERWQRQRRALQDLGLPDAQDGGSVHEWAQAVRGQLAAFRGESAGATGG
jgi:hypothetical protein